jgi:NADP-dependent 3-hydroxy acid dehydrogenase YdfG
MSSTWLITGATSGFGRLIAERALAGGARVIAVGRRRDRLAELAENAPQGRITPPPQTATPTGELTVTTGTRAGAAGGTRPANRILTVI